MRPLLRLICQRFFGEFTGQCRITVIRPSQWSMFIVNYIFILCILNIKLYFWKCLDGYCGSLVVREILHSLTELFILTITRLLWEDLATMHLLGEDYSLIYFHLCQVPVYMAEWIEVLWREQKYMSFETLAEWILTPTRLRVQHSTNELPHLKKWCVGDYLNANDVLVVLHNRQLKRLPFGQFG